MTDLLKTISVDAASELAFGSNGWTDEDGPEDLFFVEDEIVDTGRWSIYHFIVFKNEDQFYGFDYEEPATEYQDIGIEERFDANPVPVYPLVAREVVKTVYDRA